MSAQQRGLDLTEQEQRERLVDRMAREHATVAEIMEATGMADSSVRRYLNRLGWQASQTGPITQRLEDASPFQRPDPTRQTAPCQRCGARSNRLCGHVPVAMLKTRPRFYA